MNPPEFQKLYFTPLGESKGEEHESHQSIRNTNRKLADRGLFKEAINLTESHLQNHPISVEVYLFLAQIHQAQRHETLAAEYFQRKHFISIPSALFYLYLLNAKMGDLVTSEILRLRLKHIDK
jgi:hypothetical protein